MNSNKIVILLGLPGFIVMADNWETGVLGQRLEERLRSTGQVRSEYKL